jgi:hypothetical protein
VKSTTKDTKNTKEGKIKTFVPLVSFVVRKLARRLSELLDELVEAAALVRGFVLHPVAEDGDMRRVERLFQLSEFCGVDGLLAQRLELALAFGQLPTERLAFSAW